MEFSESDLQAGGIWKHKFRVLANVDGNILKKEIQKLWQYNSRVFLA